MSDETRPDTDGQPEAGKPVDGQGHGHHDHDHPDYVAHHFEDIEQQVESGKMGMWLFLATEILLFSGLFCAYAVYRHLHPEIFHFGHYFLDWKLGTLNTIILLTSSLTMAWAVRAAMLGKRNVLVINLALTLILGAGFFAVKFIEYSAKIDHGTLWGTQYRPHASDHGDGHADDDHGHDHDHDHDHDHGDGTGGGHGNGDGAGHGDAGHDHSDPAQHGTAVGMPDGAPFTAVARAGHAPAGLIAMPVDGGHGDHKDYDALYEHEPANVQVFFGIYFVMTGLHGLHVLAGMIVIAWLLWRSIRGDFSSEYNEPVDIGGLYWHLVDLIWIYLFPLLYLVD